MYNEWCILPTNNSSHLRKSVCGSAISNLLNIFKLSQPLRVNLSCIFLSKTLRFIILPHIKTIRDAEGSVYETFWHRLCLQRRITVCQCLCEIPTPHTGTRKENKHYTVNLILQSNPSITAEEAWAPICLVLPWDHISSAMPEIRFDLHGRRHLTVADVRPSAPLSLYLCLSCHWALGSN